MRIRRPNTGKNLALQVEPGGEEARLTTVEQYATRLRIFGCHLKTSVRLSLVNGYRV